MNNQIPIFEPGLEISSSEIRHSAVCALRPMCPLPSQRVDVLFIAVGTPPDEDGSADLRHVLNVAETIGRHMGREVVIVTKSTVPVGTAGKCRGCRAVSEAFLSHLLEPGISERRRRGRRFHEARSGRVGRRIGSRAKCDGRAICAVRANRKPIIFMDISSAELTKYAANAMLATRISFMNEIANLCENVGADVDLVRKGIGATAALDLPFCFQARATVDRVSRKMSKR